VTVKVQYFSRLVLFRPACACCDPSYSGAGPIDRRQLRAEVARYRTEAGLGQEGAAENRGVRPEMISRRKRGRTLPAIERLSEVGRALQVELHVIVKLGLSTTDFNSANEALILDL